MAALTNNEQGTWTASCYDQDGNEVSAHASDPLIAMMALVDLLAENQKAESEA